LYKKIIYEAKVFKEALTLQKTASIEFLFFYENVFGPKLWILCYILIFRKSLIFEKKKV